MIEVLADERFADNASKNRFEYSIDNQIVFADYRKQGDKLFINHVEAPQALRGTGAAGLLMTYITALARRDHLEIVPVCGYAAAWLKRHA